MVDMCREKKTGMAEECRQSDKSVQHTPKTERALFHCLCSLVVIHPKNHIHMHDMKNILD